MKKQKTCRVCKITKGVQRFQTDKSVKDGLRAICKDCRRKFRGRHLPPLPSPIERFWIRVNKTESCWLWLGAVSRGYGVANFNGKLRRAHRISWELVNGPIPDGLQIDHLCEVKLCVRPVHMETVTGRVNTLRCERAPAAINLKKTHCPRNHPFDGADSDGHRYCVRCRRAVWRNYYYAHRDSIARETSIRRKAQRRLRRLSK